jgi:hypothetical protein
MTREMDGLCFILVVIANITNDTVYGMEVDDLNNDFKHIKRFDGRERGQSVEEFLLCIEALARVRR